MTIDKVIWGHVEKIGKGTRANYDPDKKTITFCFKRGEETSGEQLRKLREQLMNELKTARLCQPHEIQRGSNCRKHRRNKTWFLSGKTINSNSPKQEGLWRQRKGRFGAANLNFLMKKQV